MRANLPTSVPRPQSSCPVTPYAERGRYPGVRRGHVRLRAKQDRQADSLSHESQKDPLRLHARQQDER